MKQQSYSNHAKWVIGYHLILFLAIIALLWGSIRGLLNASEDSLYPASLLVLVALILLFVFVFLRTFALKAQDRAIRAEERFRYFVLTGKLMSEKLTVRQIIGLRFASDDELVALADRAVKENLSEKEIKKAIKNWKADTYRV